MRRLFILLSFVGLIALVGAAGYYGFQSSKPKAPLAAAAPPTTAAGRGDVQQSVTAPGQLVGTHELTLSMGVGGQVSAINVQPGDTVKAGAVLATIDSSALALAERQAYVTYLSAQGDYSQTLRTSPDDARVAQANLTSAQAAYDNLFKPPSSNQTDNLKATMLNTEAAVRAAQTAYDRRMSIDAAHIGMSQEALTLERATNDYNVAKSAYDRLFEKPSDQAVQAAQAQIATAQARVSALAGVTDTLTLSKAKLDAAYLSWQQAADNIKKATLKAPFGGVVLEVKASAGDVVGASSPIVRLSDPSALAARVTVVEEDYPSVQIGQAVEMFFDARPEVTVKGKVASIIPLRDAGSNPIYPLYITLDSIPDGLAPGMTLDASILVAKKANVIRLPRSLTRARGDGTALVKVYANGETQDRNVQVGLRGNQYVEIVSGLREGELIVSR